MANLNFNSDQNNPSRSINRVGREDLGSLDQNRQYKSQEESMSRLLADKALGASRRRKPPLVIDARNTIDRSQNIDFNGDTIITIEVDREEDRDTQENTTSNYLERTKKQGNRDEFPLDNDGKAVSFSQQRALQTSSGVRRLTDSTLGGVGFGGGGAGGGGGGNGASSVAGVFGLPTPDNLQENLNISYENKHKGAGGAITDAMMNALNTALRGGNVESEVGKLGEMAKGAMNHYSKPGTLAHVMGAIGNMSGISGFNTAFNNSMVQQFSGVMNRTFNFRWKLYVKDSPQIFQIIKQLRNHAVPELIDPYMNIVRYPSRVARFDVRSPTGLLLFPVFESVITDVNVDYSASGSPFFFTSGEPTSVSLSLSLTEIQSRVKGDFG